MKLTDISPPPEETGQEMAQIMANFFRNRKIPSGYEGTPKFMVAEATGDVLKDWYERLGWGRMWSKAYMYAYPGEPWGFDNGAWHVSRHGGGFPKRRFLKRIKRTYEPSLEMDTPPFVAVCPDIVWGGLESLEFSLNCIDHLQNNYPEWPWYLAVQDGQPYDKVEACLHKFDGIFLGGSNSVKSRARVWCDLAHEHGKLFHYGRCGTRGRLSQAFNIGADSLDTAGPMMHPRQLRSFLRQWYMLVTKHGGQNE